MKRAISIICLFIFANFAVAHPFASGGGTTSSSEETDLTLILTLTVVVGVAALLVTDILADNSSNSQDQISGIIEEEEDETGFDWSQLNQTTDEIAAPLLAISIFPSSNGKDLASYFSSLIEQGNSIYFNTYHSPVSFGSMSPEEAASTGFTYLNCNWYLASASSNLQLFIQDNSTASWSFNISEWDSLSVKEAAESFLEFAPTI